MTDAERLSWALAKLKSSDCRSCNLMADILNPSLHTDIKTKSELAFVSQDDRNLLNWQKTYAAILKGE